MNLKLLIEGKEVELSSSVVVALTKEFEDLTNVTDIINTWSKTVQVPFSVQNNRIFGDIYRYDKTISVGANTPIGMDIDPSKRLEFKLLYNGALFMSGYAKLNGASMKNGVGTYNLNLFGQLGMIFNELKQLTWDNSDEEIDEKYRLKDYVKDVMSKELVKNCWSKSYTNVNFQLENADTLDFIGFAPANAGLFDSLDASSFEVNSTTKQAIKDYIEEKYPTIWGSGATANHYDLDSSLGDGLDPLAVGEYRSYLTQPYIYVPKLFEVLQDNCKKLTGYDMKFESSWFNKENPYYGRMVMLLKQFGTDGTTYDNTLGTNLDSNLAFTASYYAGTGTDRGRNGRNALKSENFTDGAQVSECTFDESKSSISTSSPIVDFDTSDKRIVMSEDYSLYASGSAQLKIKVSTTNEIWLDENTILNLRWNFTGQNGHMETYDSFIFSTRTNIGDGKFGDGTPFETREDYINFYYQNPTFLGMINYNSGEYFWYVSMPTGMKMNESTFGDYVELSVSAIYTWDQANYAPYVQYEGDDGTTVITGVYLPTTISFSDTFSMAVLADASNKRTGDIITINDLWDNDKNLLDECLQYTKMYNILWVVDDVEKTLTLMPRYVYFNNEDTVLDWSDKMDLTKDYTINPLLWDTLYAHFNYEDSETDLGTNFKESKGYNWGDKKLKLQYEFNNDDNELFEDIPCSITCTPTVLPYTRLCNQKITYVGTDSIMPSLVSDNQPVSSFGQFYMFAGLRPFDSNLDTIYITDDTSLQMSGNEYCYICPDYRTTGNSISAATYPCLDITFDDKMSTFAKPSITYDSTSKYEGATDLYTNIWQKYMEGELYNAQNKIITCYLNIRPTDFMQFEHNKLVYISGQLYLVNKIYDYDITSDSTTKCDLVRIDDVNNYKSVNYEDVKYFLPDAYVRNVSAGVGQISFTFETNAATTTAVYTSNENWTTTVSGNTITAKWTSTTPEPIASSYTFYISIVSTGGPGSTSPLSSQLTVNVIGAQPAQEA